MADAERGFRRACQPASLFTLAVLGAMTLAGCGGRDATGGSTGARSEPDATPLRVGLWRATLTLPGGELPFALEIERDGANWLAYLINGRERTRVDEVSVEGGTLRMRMPGFENTLEARIESSVLSGEVVMVKLGGKQQRIPFRAQFGDGWRFLAPAPASAENPPAAPFDVSGRWAVEFVDAGKPAPAVGEFQQDGSSVTGTFMTTTGDHRFLAGDVQGNELLLSKFDGGHAFLYRARISVGGTIEGQFWSGLAHTETFTARRDENAGLDEAASATRMRDDAAVLDIRFPDLDGRMVSLRDPQFEGKVLIVALAGSWCPNCHDEAVFLKELLAGRRERGLEVIQLMFERTPDFASQAEAARSFAAKFGIDYPVLIAGTTSDDDVLKKLPQISAFKAYPTLFAVDRKGEVRAVHTGYLGPAAGEHHEQQNRELTALVDALLDEPA